MNTMDLKKSEISGQIDYMGMPSLRVKGNADVTDHFVKRGF